MMDSWRTCNLMAHLLVVHFNSSSFSHSICYLPMHQGQLPIDIFFFAQSTIEDCCWGSGKMSQDVCGEFSYVFLSSLTTVASRGAWLTDAGTSARGFLGIYEVLHVVLSLFYIMCSNRCSIMF